MKIFKWCLQNNIRVYPRALYRGRFPKVKIVLEYKKQIRVGKKEYNQRSLEYRNKLAEVLEWAYNNAKEK
jgi:hypothetical protein